MSFNETKGAKTVSDLPLETNKERNSTNFFRTEEKLNYGAAEKISVHYFYFSLLLCTMDPLLVFSPLKLILIKNTIS